MNLLSSSDLSEKTHLVAVPWPGRGHINPMLNFCKILVTKCPQLTVTFVVTEEWKELLSSEEPPSSSMTFKSIPNVLPLEHVRGSVYAEFYKAVFTNMEAPVDKVLQSLHPPASVILTDTLLWWAVAMGEKKNIPVVCLWTMSPSVFAVFYHFDLLSQHGHFPADLTEQGDEVVDYIPGMSSTHLSDLPAVFSGTGRQMVDGILKAFSLMKKTQGIIFNTFYELESQLIDNLKQTLPLPIYCIGPLIPHTNPDPNKENYLNWLDSQPKNSVLYISVGSFLSGSQEQMNKIMTGLHESGVRYLWVEKKDTSYVQETCGEMGLVVPWCDQLKVLCHSSVGGFLTHCGWNSILESIFAGVPMLAYPLVFDQIPNRKLIVNDLKVGMMLEMNGKDGEKSISKVLQEFMSLGGNGSIEIRQKVGELKEICRKTLVHKGGSFETNIDAFIVELLKYW